MAIICNSARDFNRSFEWLFYENAVADFREAHLRGAKRPDEIWGSRSEMGCGFAFRTHTAFGRGNALFVLREAREALSLDELDAIMAHELAHLELRHLDEVGDAFDGKIESISPLRRFKMELEADRASMKKTSPQALYSGLLTLLTATELAVGGVEPGCEEAFVKEYLKKDLQFRVRLGVIRARIVVDKIRSWFGR